MLRKLNTDIPTLDVLEFAGNHQSRFRREKTGLVLVTGATGSGKSTTLAAVLNEINQTKPVHIITLEDPVEFVHPHDNATFNQRELGTDFDNFANGLRAALRQAPKVILVGEMRDRETVKIALERRGNRPLGVEHAAHDRRRPNDQSYSRYVRTRGTGADSRAPGRHAALGHQPAAGAPGSAAAAMRCWKSWAPICARRKPFAMGESEGKSFYEIIEASQPFGWRTFDYSALEAYEQGKISEETALLYCTKRGPVTRGIDNIKKARGESTTTMNSLRMKAGRETRQRRAPPPMPGLLKLK